MHSCPFVFEGCLEQQHFCVLVTVGESVLKHRHINILLEGLDTVASVTLNNVLLVNARNMFQRYVVDVTDVIEVRLKFYIHLEVQ